MNFGGTFCAAIVCYMHGTLNSKEVFSYALTNTQDASNVKTRKKFCADFLKTLQK